MEYKDIKDSKRLHNVDYFFNKMIPKKFVVICLASVFVFMGLLGGDMWAYLAMIYMGTNGLQKVGLGFGEFMKKGN